jgi:O-antigen ligase
VSNTSSHTSDGYFVFLSGFFLVSIAAAAFSSFYWLAALPFLLLLWYFGWRQWQFIFMFLIFSLPWSVEFDINETLATDLPDEPLMWFAAFLFVSYSVMYPWKVMSNLKHPLIVLLICYLAWILVTLPFSTNWILSLKFLLAKGWYVAAFVFLPLQIFNNKKSIQSTALIFLGSLFAVVVISLYRHALTGFRFADINHAVAPFFRNHVNYSSMLVCTVPVLIASYQLNKKYRLLIAVMGITILTALFFSYGRGAWLALLAGLGSYWLIRSGKLLIALVIAAFLISGAVFWLKSNDRYLQYAHDYKTTIYHKNFEEHLVATYKLKDVSTAERFNRWIAGVRMVKDNWLTGYGPNTFYYNYKPYAIPAFKTWVSDNKDHSTVHNYFLLTVIEQGVPGLALLLLLIGSMAYYSEKLYQRVQDKFYKACAMACGVMLVMLIVVNFLSDLIESDKVGSLFFLCLAALVAINKNASKEMPRQENR